jgi:hypothetical protein
MRNVFGLETCAALAAIFLLGCGEANGGTGTAGSTEAGAGGAATGSGSTGGTGAGDGGRMGHSTGEPGVWMDVTPGPETGYSPGTFGPQTMLVDAARPGEFIFTSTESGVFKSTDFGETWAKISDERLIYGCAADPDPDRDPSKPLKMWCSGGYGTGMARSTDGGVTWTKHLTNNGNIDDNGFANEPYSVDVDPYDSKHLLAGFHGNPGLSESKDGGLTWKTIAAVDGAYGTSIFPFFIDAGSAEATRGNWLVIPQWGSSGGIARTTDGGASWTQTNSLQHGHGNAQIFVDGSSGVVYAAGYDGNDGHGVYRSSDFGMTWTRVNDGTVQNGVFATPNFVYADNGWANAGGQPQMPQRAPRSTGTEGAWMNYAPETALTNGSGHAAVSFDEAKGKWVIVIGAWTAGIWRYIEP